MSDLLAREEAPLSSEDWQALDNTVINTARRVLVGRRFIHIAGPLGLGAQFVTSPKLKVPKEGIIEVQSTEAIPLTLIYKDFKLDWRLMEASRQQGLPLELSPAAIAAYDCALNEDKLIFEKLMSVDGKLEIQALDWKVPGNAFINVVSAIEALTGEGYFGPYAMIVSPSLYALMHRVYNGTGVLEITMIRDLVTDGLFQSPVLKEGDVLIVATGAENFDLAIGQDLITAYLGPDGLDHMFRVLETLALRIKRPNSICCMTGGD